jgi:ElaB/YqjD/DUF883 family membrane-anchored ribosome-binding protein
MELYYRDLISKDASLEKLVDDLMLVVQGAEEFAEATGSGLPKEHQEELTSRLQRLKEGCRNVQQQARQTALAVDKVIRQYPYSSAGIGFGVGLIAGILIKRLR